MILHNRSLAVVFVLLPMLAAEAVSAGPYLSDLLKRPAYLASWNRLLQQPEHVESWLKDYASTLDGPNTPSETVVLSDGEYARTTVCEAHNCGPNIFHVLFSPDATQAWGILLKNRKQEIVFGEPDSEKVSAIRKFMWK
jgi:hypothetical protein